jgi:two-component system, cell cycle response regulator
MIDIDHFKRVNDSCGHTVGDAVLRAVATAIKNTVRSVDVVCRYGGEEFVVLLPEDENPGITAERVRKAVEGITVHTVNNENKEVEIKASVSIVAGLFTLADGAMYQAKAAGRNRVVVAAGHSLSQIP